MAAFKDSTFPSIGIFINLSAFPDTSSLKPLASLPIKRATFFSKTPLLYSSPFNNKYYLSLCMPATDEHILNKICSILTENGHRETPTYAKELFYMEHFEEIVANKAIEKLGKI